MRKKQKDYISKRSQDLIRRRGNLRLLRNQERQLTELRKLMKKSPRRDRERERERDLQRDIEENYQTNDV